MSTLLTIVSRELSKPSYCDLRRIVGWLTKKIHDYPLHHKSDSRLHQLTVSILPIGTLDLAMINELLEANKYARPVVAKILRQHGHTASVEDVLQETLLKAYSHREQFKGSSKLSTWYTRIAINTALTFLRLNRREFVPLENFDESFVSPAKSPEVLAYQRELAVMALKKVLQLPAVSRAAVVASIVGGTPMNSTQKSRLCRARQALRKQLMDARVAPEFEHEPPQESRD